MLHLVSLPVQQTSDFVILSFNLDRYENAEPTFTLLLLH